MKISISTNQPNINLKTSKPKYRKNILQPTKIKQFVKLDKNSFRPENVSRLPLKMYLLGLTIPIPFASTTGLILGSIIALGIKLKHFVSKNKTS